MNKWTNMTLKRGSVDEALSAVTKFKVPRFVIYRDICNTLERDGRLTEAVECFQRMENELPEDAGVRDEQAEWELGGWLQPQTRIARSILTALEQNGDVAMDSASYEEAVAHYSTALSLNHSSADLLTKRSRARAGNGSWEDSLQDADAVITLDPSSLSGHERRHAALLGAHRYDEAINAHNHMLLMLEQSADLVTRAPVPSVPFEDDAEPFTPVGGDGDLDAPFTNPRPPSSSYPVSSSHHSPQFDKLTRALRLL
ncbi:hypothetical protein HD554DRAFT_2326879 [Boletus coccyginus]|nr:hypothetical protein HD554DRAFT_2326879 [Boletus coccyginus]